MPNWITNILEFNENENLSAIKQFCKGPDNDVLDFNKFVPAPKFIDYADMIYPNNPKYKFRNLAIMIYESNEMKKSTIFDIDQFMKIHEHRALGKLALMKQSKLVESFSEYASKVKDDFKIDYKKDIDKFIDYLVSCYKDFAVKEKVIGMFFGNVLLEGDEKFYAGIYPEDFCKVFKEYKRDICKDAILEQGKFYFDLLVEYGVDNWYDWNSRYWGTKWNACEAIWADNHTLGFNTAWAPPVPIICKLKELFPDLQITYYWVDEGNPLDPHMYYTDRFNRDFVENVIEGPEEARQTITDHIYDTFYTKEG